MSSQPLLRPLPRILVWGELLWDRFPDGDQLGGAPTNVAFHLGQLAGVLPLSAALITRVGADAAGARAREILDGELERQLLLDTSLIQVDPDRATGEVLVTLAGGEPRYHLVPDRAWEHIEVTPAVLAATSTASALVYGPLSQRAPAGLASFRALLEATPRTCLRVCDPNLRPGTLDLPALTAALDAADVVKLGEQELRTCNEALGDAHVLATLRARCRLVAITRGTAGSTLYAGDEVLDVAASPARPGGDNVGCGDAYVAALTAGVVLGWPLARTGVVASRLAAFVAGARGATPTLAPADLTAILA
jgi:fructokinase